MSKEALFVVISVVNQCYEFSLLLYPTTFCTGKILEKDFKLRYLHKFKFNAHQMILSLAIAPADFAYIRLGLKVPVS